MTALIKSSGGVFLLIPRGPVKGVIDPSRRHLLKETTQHLKRHSGLKRRRQLPKRHSDLKRHTHSDIKRDTTHHSDLKRHHSDLKRHHSDLKRHNTHSDLKRHNTHSDLKRHTHHSGPRLGLPRTHVVPQRPRR